MPDQAVMYTISAHKRYHTMERCPLGDIDGRGTALRELLLGLPAHFGHDGEPVEDRAKRLICGGSEVRDNGDLLLRLDLAETGVAAQLRNREGDDTYRRLFTDAHVVRCHAVLRMRGGAHQGFVALHITGGRSYKTLLAEMIKRHLLSSCDVTLRLEPVTEAAVVRQAIVDGGIKSVTLQSLVRPGDRAIAETDEWIDGGEHGHIKVTILPERGKNLAARALRRLLDPESTSGDEDSLSRLVTFRGVEFDELKVEAKLSDGRLRTYNVTNPVGGHPISIELTSLERAGADEGYTESSIVANLTELLDEKMP